MGGRPRVHLEEVAALTLTPADRPRSRAVPVGHGVADPVRT